MWYYLLILVSIAMFGAGFGLQDLYRKRRGSGIRISMESACIGGAAGLIVLLFINGFSFSVTGFTVLMAALSAINSLLFTFCAFKALDYINLSLFSVFTMLGGMVLPFLQGILFYGEAFTLPKIICVIFICAALLCTVEKGEKKRGIFFYIGIFVLNGMSGVISKLYIESELPKLDAAGYSVWCAVAVVVLSGICWFVLSYKERKAQDSTAPKIEKPALWQSYGIGALQGSINRVANFLLVLALAHVDASVQYPMVTGGTMIVSTIISFFGEKKPSLREIISVVLAFSGMLALFLSPA